MCVVEVGGGGEWEGVGRERWKKEAFEICAVEEERTLESVARWGGREKGMEGDSGI